MGVDCDARRLVRDGGRRGVVGREGIVPDRVREWEWEDVRWWFSIGVVVTEAMLRYCCGGKWSVDLFFVARDLQAETRWWDEMR